MPRFVETSPIYQEKMVFEKFYHARAWWLSGRCNLDYLLVKTRLGEAVLMCTHNQCLEQKMKFKMLPISFLFFPTKNNCIVHGHVFEM